ncbi:TonB-dependent receptor [Prevotella sp. S7 MS 2]|uniref:TonB-dependent receptor n=1 Tax=Prevotella sp. S7 MS 2 TaxID=1287488 RepID=UPI000514648F|nr:TonB-dependent receptor [Prevotella sp. S7 MS 2]
MIGKLRLFLCMALMGFLLPMNAETDTPPSKTEANVYGHVVDRKTGEHLPYAHVVVKGTTLETATDATGHYFLKNLPLRLCQIEVTMVGYRTAVMEVTTKKNVSSELNFSLEEDAISLDEVVTTANRTQTLRREAPNLVNVIDSKIFKTTNAMCMAQGLNFQPGVRTEDNCQNCGFSQVRINGLDGHYSQILIDSRPTFSSLNGVYGLEQIPASMIERVEVVRGGGSALYGASAIGGTINIITREPLRNSAEVAHTLTSINGKSGRIENNTTANLSIVSEDGKTGLSAYTQYHYRPGYDHDGDGYTELPNLRNETLGLNAFYKLNAYSKLRLQLHHIGEFRRGGNHLERAPHESNITEQLDHNVNGGNLSYDFISRSAVDRVKAYFSFGTTQRKSYYGGIAEGTPDDVETALKAYGRTRDFTYVLGGQYVHSFAKLGFMPAHLTLGGEYHYDGLKDEINGYNHLLEQKVRIYSGYVQNEWRNEAWTLLVGGRLDKHSMIRHAIFSPRVNVRYNPSQAVSLRIGYAGGFRAPQAFDEDLHVGYAGGERVMTQLAANLKEERSHSFSLSADLYHNFGNVQTNFLVEGFYTMLRDVFALRNLEKKDSEGNSLQERYNGSGAKVFGLNFEGKVAMSRWFDFQAGLTLQRSLYDELTEWDEAAPKVKKMLRTPSTYGYFTASLHPVRRLTLSLSGNYTGTMLVGHAAHTLENGKKVAAEAVQTPTFFTLNTKVAYEWPLTAYMKMEVNAGIQNITNDYQRDFDRGWGRDSGYIYGPGQPRCFFAGVKFSY